MPNYPYAIRAQLTMNGEIMVDNFAGGGGASTGLELAFGRVVDIAVNHALDAILMHKTNHPHTTHFHEDVYKVSPTEVCQGRPVGLAWFSPTCTHFSRAKGLPLVDRHIRGLAWVTLRWIEEVRPRVIILENVPEFQTWGPLMPDPLGRGEVPDPAHKGETFDAFVKMLTTGIKEPNDALCEACGELKWDPNGKEAQNLLAGYGYKVEFRKLIAADYGAPTTRERFFMVMRCDGRPIVWPEPTHAPRDSEAVKSGAKLPWRSAAEIIDWSKPCPSIFATRQEIKEEYGLRAQRPLADNTMGRIAHGLDKHLIRSAEPFLVEVNHKGGDFRGQDIKQPLHTVTAKLGTGLVDPVMCPWNVTNTSNSVGTPLSEPVHTARTAGGGGQMLCGASLTQYHAGKGSERRGQDLNRPLMTIDTAGRYSLMEAHLTEYYGNSQTGCHLSDPLHTVTCKDRHAIVHTHLTEFYGTNQAGRAVTEPVSTITSQSGHHGLIAASISKYYSGVVGTSCRDPLPTVTAIDHNALQAVTLSKLPKGAVCGSITKCVIKADPGLDLGRWPQVRTMLNKHCDYHLEDDELLLLNINGVWYFISDVGMRMLIPRELYNANGFPPDYIIDKDYMGNDYKPSKQVARVGNSVPPAFATALARANLPEWCVEPPLATMAELEDRVAV